ncbi:MAG: hypothetical protein JXA67_17840, partial [Micromonosporaceae bacterium]|nr:hypothetical protein [Micromonosporaceae bacterium]
DEPSEGLAPVLAADLAGVLRDLADDGLAILLAEQHLSLALGTADQVHVLHNGTMVLSQRITEFTSGDGQRQLRVVLGTGVSG